MSIAFIHLSDIHFGQEKGSEIHINNDLRDCLIYDAKSIVKTEVEGNATGVIVTGDIAFSGKQDQYVNAANWLDRLTEAIGCAKTEVILVPGNHDIDRSAITYGCKLLLEAIFNEGQERLESILKVQLDREQLYNRFNNYRPFAEGYDCPLDTSGGLASYRSYQIASGRTLRFIGLNSALTCSEVDTEGTLLLGTRQHILPRNDGEELVVLSHHPLNWLKDSEDVRRYIRSRARVFISGHEHNPSSTVETIKEGQDLMLIASGATTPPKAEDTFGYTYNLLIFEWDSNTDGLNVKTIPRVWSPSETKFVAGTSAANSQGCDVVLGCPNFKNVENLQQIDRARLPATINAAHSTRESPTKSQPEKSMQQTESISENFPLLLLRFFRDLSPAQRLTVLVELRALPESWQDPLTHAMERHVVDGLARSGRLAAFEEVINKIEGEKPRS